MKTCLKYLGSPLLVLGPLVEFRLQLPGSPLHQKQAEHIRFDSDQLVLLVRIQLLKNLDAHATLSISRIAPSWLVWGLSQLQIGDD